MYLLPLSDILNLVNVNYNYYADDFQIYLVIDSSTDLFINNVDDPFSNVSTWSFSVNLEQNYHKIELIFVSRQFIPQYSGKNLN